MLQLGQIKKITFGKIIKGSIGVYYRTMEVECENYGEEDRVVELFLSGDNVKNLTPVIEDE